MSTYKILSACCIAILIIAPISCSKDDPFSTFDDAIQSGGEFGSISYSYEENEIGESETQEGDEIWTCTSKVVSIQDALGGENGFSLFSPNANVVFPGNLIQGKSLYKATPDNIPADRGGGEITISILDGNDISSVYVDKISLGSVTTAANEILAGRDAESVIPANFQYSKSVVQSEREFAYKIKADYENAWASISGSLSFSGNNTYSRMMLTLEQSFYQLSFTEPSSIEDFFAPTANPEDLDRFVGPGNPPCYISSVNYGRIFYMLIEAVGSESELKTSVDAAFKTPIQEGGGNIDTENFEKFDEVNIKIFAFGGDAETTIQAIELDKNELYKLGDILAKATDIRTALPISYKVQSVKTNEVVAVPLATQYEIRECYVTSALPPPVRTEHWEGMIDLLGSPVCAAIRTRSNPSNKETMFFDSTGTKYVLDDGFELSGPFDISKLNNGNPFPLEDIGAGGTFLAGHWDRTYVINKRGNRAVYMDTNVGWSSPFPIEDDPHLEYYSIEGIGAASDGEWGFQTVNKAGTGIHIEPYFGGNPAISELPIFILTGGEDNKFEDGISAMTKLAPKLYATISKDGKRYMVAELEKQRFWGPFKL